MTKHIAGIILFTFIVGTSAVVAGLFFETPHRYRSFSAKHNYSGYKRKKRRKRRCRKHRKPKAYSNVRLNQAVFEMRTGELRTSVSFGDALYSEEGETPTFYYHFYTLNEMGSNYLGSERIGQGAQFVTGMRDRFVRTSHLGWLSDRIADGEVYIIVRNVPDQPFGFDVSKATPILIKNGF